MTADERLDSWIDDLSEIIKEIKKERKKILNNSMTVSAFIEKATGWHYDTDTISRSMLAADKYDYPVLDSEAYRKKHAEKKRESK